MTQRTQADMPQRTQNEFVTIIATSAGEAMRQFKAQGLDREGYSIATQIGRHRFSVVAEDAATELFAGDTMFAATFMRAVPAA